MVYQDIMIERKPFVWRTLQEHNDTNDNISCRNSVQGKLMIVDDRGKLNVKPFHCNILIEKIPFHLDMVGRSLTHVV